jgi:hypothetical protein
MENKNMEEFGFGANAEFVAGEKGKPLGEKGEFGGKEKPFGEKCDFADGRKKPNPENPGFENAIIAEKGGDLGKEKGVGRPLTLLQFVEFAEKANIPFRMDCPGFTRIAVDFQEQLRKPFASIGRGMKLGIANVSF